MRGLKATAGDERRMVLRSAISIIFLLVLLSKMASTGPDLGKGKRGYWPRLKRGDRDFVTVYRGGGISYFVTVYGGGICSAVDSNRLK
ncbi:unnamed protein product, partial [Iphiclides podalirius]